MPQPQISTLNLHALPIQTELGFIALPAGGMRLSWPAVVVVVASVAASVMVTISLNNCLKTDELCLCSEWSGCGCQEVIKPTSKVTMTTAADEAKDHHLTSSSSSAAEASATSAVESHTQLIPLPGPNMETGSTIDKIVSSSSSGTMSVMVSGVM